MCISMASKGTTGWAAPLGPLVAVGVAEDLQVFQVAVGVGDLGVDEAGRSAHAPGPRRAPERCHPRRLGD
jgi:hypothetical protein